MSPRSPRRRVLAIQAERLYFIVERCSSDLFSFLTQPETAARFDEAAALAR